jgi:heme/copper-type cytochrome/quinol oxidase subunit 2
MNATWRRCTTIVLTLITIAILTSNALAHAGEAHADPVTSILHQGSSAVVVTLLIIGLVGTGAWLHRRRSDSNRTTEPEQ